MCRTMAERDIQNRFMDTVREGEVGRIEAMTWKHILPYVRWIQVGICCVTQGTQPDALRQPAGVGNGGR